MISADIQPGPMTNPFLSRIPLLLILLLLSLQAAATSLLPLSLQQMTQAAEVIFHGRTISNEVKLDQPGGRVATFTRFEVIEVIKGKPEATHSIKQIGGQMPGSRYRQVIHGVPRFTIGEEYVVFLPKASSLGFSSPIGLAQGKFDIRTRDGVTTVSNGRPLAAMLSASTQQSLANIPSAVTASPAPALTTLPDRPASARLADFMQTVRSLLEE